MWDHNKMSESYVLDFETGGTKNTFFKETTLFRKSGSGTIEAVWAAGVVVGGVPSCFRTASGTNNVGE